MQPQCNRKLRTVANSNVAYSKNRFHADSDTELSRGPLSELLRQDVPQSFNKLAKKHRDWISSKIFFKCISLLNTKGFLIPVTDIRVNVPPADQLQIAMVTL